MLGNDSTDDIGGGRPDRACAISRRDFTRVGALASAAAITSYFTNSIAFGAVDSASDANKAAAGLGEGDGRAAAAGPERGRERRDVHANKAALTTISPDGVATRLAILSDAHVASDDNTAIQKLETALQTLAWAAPGIDTLFMLGDVSVNGYFAELDAFAVQVAKSLSSYSPAAEPDAATGVAAGVEPDAAEPDAAPTEPAATTPATAPVMHLLMGNHDCWNCEQQQFESFFAAHAFGSFFDAQQNSVAKLNGATVIKLNGADSFGVDMLDYSAAYDFLATALAEAASARPNEPILVMAHEPPENMSLPASYESGFFGQGTERDMVALIAQYPQARMFSGHIHNPLDLPETVNQELGFTMVHTSTVGSCFFVRANMVDRDESGSHGLVLDVLADGSLKLYCLDFGRQQLIDAHLL
jgi:hypothetical protein